MNFKNWKIIFWTWSRNNRLRSDIWSGVTRFYYPLQSLNRLLGTELTEEEMIHALEEFSAYAEERLGKVKASSKNERFCITLPPQASDYVHENRKPKWIPGALHQYSSTPRLYSGWGDGGVPRLFPGMFILENYRHRIRLSRILRRRHPGWLPVLSVPGRWAYDLSQVHRRVMKISGFKPETSSESPRTVSFLLNRNSHTSIRSWHTHRSVTDAGLSPTPAASRITRITLKLPLP